MSGSEPPPTLEDRCLGALPGLACGDAVGTTVEFCPRGSFAPLTDLVGGGPFGLAAGQWTTGEPFAGSTDPRSAGNGALMRLAPVVLYYYPSTAEIQHYAVESSRTTHAAPEALDCARLLAHVLSRALAGSDRTAMLDAAALGLAEPKVAALASGQHREKRRDEIAGTGYAVAALAAALWCFQTTGSFEEAVLTAANLGDDADTTAAITGQIAGAHYGVRGIPDRWRRRLHRGAEIEGLAHRLIAKPRDT